MDDKEVKILRSILKAYEREREPFYLRVPFIATGWVVLVFVLVWVKRLLEANNLNIYAAMFIMLSAGVAIGFISILKAGYKCQPYIKPYLDLELIRRQVAENENNA